MYSLSIPVSAIRTRIRQQFERHRYVSQLKVIDVLLFQSHSEYQVRFAFPAFHRLLQRSHDVFVFCHQI
jgi:NADH dehydrogenase (ubiquinone) 1 alpha subcomplex subunit 6